MTERLVHSTKNNIAKYDFDVRFYKFPSYFRRSAIQSALGAVSSYRSNLTNWEKSQTGRKPTLQKNRFVMPTFYNKAMFLKTNDPEYVYLKLYDHHDWVWQKVRLLPTDVKYLRRFVNCEKSAPSLVKKHKKYFLCFAFTEDVKMKDTPIEKQRVCAVDLGLNNDAVCSIMHSDGTVLVRKFINFPSEKDQLDHVVNRIRRFQRKHGSQNTQSFWKYAQRLNDELAKKISAAVIDFAVQNSADCIVFEYLDFKGKKKHGSKAQKLSLWRKNGIQNYVEHKAHRCGIRISRICAWGTSRLAFDGSGRVERDQTNQSLCTFATGKRYHCDLSAPYNIGARYFIREIIKPLPVKVRSQIQAKVPEAGRRTSCTLDTLLRINATLAA